MKLENVCRTLVLIVILPFLARAQVQEIRVTGEYTTAGLDTPAAARQLALLDAKRKALQEAGIYLRNAPAVKKLQLSPNQIDAYVMGLVEPLQQSTATTPNGSRTVHRVQALARIDTAAAARQLDGIRNDKEASMDLLELWKQAQQLWPQIVEQNKTPQDRQIIATELEVDLMLAQVCVALSRQESGPASDRVASVAGRKRAKDNLASAP